MISSLHFFVNPINESSDDVFLKRLHDVSDRLNKRGYSWPAPFLGISNCDIKQCVVGPNHIAFLLRDGRVCRSAYNVFPDLLVGGYKDDSKSHGKGSSSGAQPTAPSSRGNATDVNGNSANKPKVRRVAVVNTASRGRARGVIVGSRPLIPVSAVPEDLIAQAQVVLQGKSRDVIMRELQRTNLDVNLAVNNLLSRDDDDGDEYDDVGDSFLPEELISLLDGGLLDHQNVMIDADGFYSDEVFGFSAIRRRVNERSSAALHAERALSSKEQEAGPSRTTAKSAASSAVCPIIPSSQVEFWDEQDSTVPKFEDISAMYSELTAVSANGELFQWRWSDAKPLKSVDGKSNHPRASTLQLNGEIIIGLSSSLIRTTVLTHSNKVASFVDESLGFYICNLLDSPCLALQDPVLSVVSCPLYSCARTKNGCIYWWGVMPFNLRKRVWDKAKARAKKHVTFDNSDVTIGSQVRLRSNPLYQVGSVAFTTLNGFPQVGTLMEAAWTLNETCRFRIKNPKISKPPSDDAAENEIARLSDSAVEDNSAQQQLQQGSSGANDANKSPKSPRLPGETSKKRSKRQASELFNEDDVSGFREEAWCLKDVVFVEEAKVFATGTVVMVDGAYCAVLFPDKENSSTDHPSPALTACRLMRKDELHVYKPGHVPKLPDCVQKEPKKLNIRRIKGQLIELAADSQGLKLLVQKQQKLYLTAANLAGKMEGECCVSSNASAFMGNNSFKPRLLNYGEESVCLLTDGNGCLYSLAKDCLGNVREPPLLYLPPALCLGIGVHSTKNASFSRSKNRLLAGAVVLKSQSLMDSILRCDIESVKQFLRHLEKDINLDKADCEIVQAKVGNNCNILHACIAMCGAQSNRDAVDLKASTGGNITLLSETNAASSAKSGRSFYETKHWEDLIAPSLRGFESARAIAVSLRSSEPLLGSGPASGSGVASIASDAADHRQHAAGDVAAGAEASASLLDVAVPLVSWPPQERMDASENSIDDDVSAIPLPLLPRTISNPKQRQINALGILKLLCESPFMSSYLVDLLSEKDGTGRTPFLFAIYVRTYWPAIILFDTIQALAKATANYSEACLQMLQPEHAENPLLLLCVQDTCSYTWTGCEHINQDIFECKTCGLVGSLCCCTECAAVCHRGHDCKLKRTSPTAYCDCWEKCSCKALVAGDQNARFLLLSRMLEKTDLVSSCGDSQEHVLLYLVRTVGRQMVEQHQYSRSARLRSLASQKPPDAGDLEVPESDLEPPRFARRALDRLLSDWKAVKSMLSLGMNKPRQSAPISEDEFHLSGQAGSVHLDKFTYCLLLKCSSETLDVLINTIIREVLRGSVEANDIACRFVRSVVRVFVIVNAPVGPNASKRRRFCDRSDPILKCRRVFQSLIVFALIEILEAADALLAPVRLGLCLEKSLSLCSTFFEASEICDKSFSVDPFAQFSSASIVAVTKSSALDTDRVGTLSDQRQHRDAADDAMDQTSESDSESEHSGLSSRDLNQSFVSIDSSTASSADQTRSSARRSAAAPSTDGGSRSHHAGRLFADGPNPGPSGAAVVRSPAQSRLNQRRAFGSRSFGRGNAASTNALRRSRRVEPEPPRADSQAERVGSQQPDRQSETTRAQESVRISASSAASSTGASVAADPAAGEASTCDAHSEDIPPDDEDEDDDESVEEENSFHYSEEDAADNLSCEDDDESVESPIDSDEEESMDDEENDENVEMAHDYETAADFMANVFDNRLSNRLVDRSFSPAFSSGPTSGPAPSLGWALRSSAAAASPALANTQNPSSFASVSNDRERSQIVTSAAPSQGNTSQSSLPSAPASGAPNVASAVSSSSSDRGGMVFLDAASLRRGTGMGFAGLPFPVASEVAAGSASAKDATNSTASVVSTAQLISRVFGILVRQLTDLIVIAREYHVLAPSLPKILEVKNIDGIIEFIGQRLQSSWDWLFCALDSLEAQLKFGCALASNADSASPQLGRLPFASSPLVPHATVAAAIPDASSSLAGGAANANVAANTASPAAVGVGASSAHASATDPRRIASRMILNASNAHEPADSQTTAARQDCLHYLLSLLRSHSSEHRDELPVLDILTMKHVAYVADALFYHIETLSAEKQLSQQEELLAGLELKRMAPLRIGSVSAAPPLRSGEMANEQKVASPTVDANHAFFKRADSMCFLGMPEPLQPFENSIDDSLPLARRSLLLQPDATKEQLFSVKIKPLSSVGHLQAAAQRGNPRPLNLSLSHPKHFSFASSESPVGEVIVATATSSSAAQQPATTASLSSTLSVSSHFEHASGCPEKRVTRSAKGSTATTGAKLTKVEAAETEAERTRKQSVIVHSSSVGHSDGEASTAAASSNAAESNATTSSKEQRPCMSQTMSAAWLTRLNFLMSRWKLSLFMFAKVFADDVGQEPGSIFVKLAGYSVKEASFRKAMEKLRSQQSKDLIIEVDRERHFLIQQTVKLFNQHFSRRSGATASPPMAVHKVKVTFKDEPGEGSGVARSFYAAVAEAFLSQDCLPALEHCNVGAPSNKMQHQLLNRLRTREREREQSRRQRSSVRRYALNASAPAFVPSAQLPQEQNEPLSFLDASRQGLGDRLFVKVRQMRPALATQITGMLIELPLHQVVVLLTSEESLRAHVDEATDVLLMNNGVAQIAAESELMNVDADAAVDYAAGGRTSSADARNVASTRRAISTPNLGALEKPLTLDPEDFVDNAPLFFQPSNNGFYAPNPGRNSAERINAFRNVGRLIGLCLLQNELLPLPLCRHVLKYILGRPITWYDLAFYDADLFETLRTTVEDGVDPQDLHLTFSCMLLPQEGGGSVDLKPDGSNIDVTSENFTDYIYLYVNLRLVKIAEKALEAMRQGVFDVLPTNALLDLTSEDLRLLLNGLADVNLKLLQAYTTFADESNAPADQLAKFKKWFWSVVAIMSPEMKQELVYFWTGSPSLPSSEEGFQPSPSVLIRPADDQHLPTANTCISRLYVPLYSSKHVLQQKLQLAIKARNFGFV